MNTEMFTRISIAVLILAMSCSKNASQIPPGNGSFSIPDHDPDVYVQFASGMTQFQTPIVQDAHALSQLNWTTDYGFRLRQRRNIIIQVFDKENFSSGSLFCYDNNE